MAFEIPEITLDQVGVWISSHNGWRGIYRGIDIAVDYGFIVPGEYRDALADYRENGPSAHEDNWEAIIGQGELSDMATDFLQDRAPDGYVFMWEAGELTLISESEADACW